MQCIQCLSKNVIHVVYFLSNHLLLRQQNEIVFLFVCDLLPFFISVKSWELWSSLNLLFLFLAVLLDVIFEKQIMWKSLCPLWQLMPRECINSLFDNFTWTKISGSPAPPGLGRSSAWLHPHVSVFVILLLFCVMKVSLPLAVYSRCCLEIYCMW